MFKEMFKCIGLHINTCKYVCVHKCAHTNMLELARRSSKKRSKIFKHYICISEVTTYYIYMLLAIKEIV